MIVAMEQKNPDGRTPFVSVLMPVYNEGQFIQRSLGAVLTQTYPHERMEVFVIDGLSQDNTVEVCSELIARADMPVEIIPNPGKFVAPGLNAGLRMAHGAVIVRVDGHCVIAPDYVQNCVAHLQDSTLSGVGGAMETIGETADAELIAAAMRSPFGVGGSAFRTGKRKNVFVETVPFPAYRKADIERFGFYDENFIRNQDDEYNYRILDLGGKLLLAEDVNSTYYSRSSFRSLWRQYFQYGYFKVRVMQKHPRQMRLRQFIPSLWLAALIFLIATAIFLPLSRWLLLAVAVSYFLTAVWFSIKAVLRTSQKFKLPFVFLILHSAYGLGFLTGLWDFYLHRSNTPVNGMAKGF
jgi:glycosyltransferase involved in cell wall biosynthesis